jgi:hypothetical protein
MKMKAYLSLLFVAGFVTGYLTHLFFAGHASQPESAQVSGPAPVGMTNPASSGGDPQKTAPSSIPSASKSWNEVRITPNGKFINGQPVQPK